MENYEQKYKEALEMAKVAALNGHQNLMEGIFPELKESEDEKIRKEIIAILQYKYEKFSKDPKYCNTPQWLAWLEKQGEQKSSWSEEDNMMLECVLDKIGDLGTGVMCKEWLKSLKQRYAWKPTSAQMEALDSAIDEFDGYQEYDSLVSLKRDLEKLKRE